MTKAQAEKRVKKLREVIAHHRYQYHVLDKQELSDAALDSLKHELFQLEQTFPELVTPDSPTQRVGGKPLKDFAKVTHRSRMLSMEDVFSEEEFLDWVKRLQKHLGKPIEDFYCMTKIDGLAVSLTYKNGVLVKAATRGDGRIGEDVTQNAKTVESIPLTLRSISSSDLKRFGLGKDALMQTLDVRGEIYMTKDDFEELNRRRKKAGEPLFANPRNVSAGSIRQLDPEITKSRPLKFRAWSLETIGQASHVDSMRMLTLLGFKTAEGSHAKQATDVSKRYAEAMAHREELPYWIDGLVVRVNSHEMFRDLGVVGKTPRGLAAWKFPPEEAATQLRSVHWQVGRTGKLTPVATVEPVFLAGTTVEHATLHNMDEIARLDVKIGDTVILTKAGDIIPKIIDRLKEMRTGSETTIQPPKTCPVCKSPVEKRGGVDLYCSNKGCFSLERGRVLYAARAFGIDGLGMRTVERFIEEGLLVTPPDLFRLNPDEIAQLEGFGAVSAKKLVQEIDKHKTIALADFLTSLGIASVGEETAFSLAQTFGTLDAVKRATKAEFLQVQDVGDVVAESLHEFFASHEAADLLRDYAQVGVVVTAEKKAAQTLLGKTFVVTGTLEGFSRDEAKDAIRLMGGSVSGSVSKKTDFVVVGENPGSKYDDAKQLGVKTLSEQAFLRMIGRGT